ncbi:glycosyltransferase [Clostridium baratii]|uniref:glycosyltransferase n=2 Tax=Clostridium baratii TaxID=1561 RepID=UPI00374E5C7F
MNILVIPSWYENKNNKTHGSFFKEQAKSLADRGHNVYILYVDIIRFNEIGRMITTEKYKFYDDGELKVFRKKFIKLPKLSEKYVIKNVELGIKDLYEKFIKDKIKIDVIHAHSFIWGGYAGVKLSKKYNIPIMVTEHYTGYSRNIFSNEEKNILKYAINSCDKCIAVSNGLKSDMKNYTNRNIDIIYNMVDTEKFRFDKNKNLIKENRSKFIFSSVCYLMKKKGIDILLKAFKVAFNNDDTVELHIGGDGEERSNLEDLTKELGIQNKVKFYGYLNRDSVVNLMKSSECFVLPSRYETFGVVYIEALALGKPVIATNTDAIFDIVNDNNGIIVEKENIKQLSEALRYIKENYHKYDQELISKECILKFSKDVIVKEIENELLNLVKN